MNEKHGVTAIIFDEQNNKRFFLVLHRVLNWAGWEFVKGGIDKGENPKEAVFREIEEETSLKKVTLIAELSEKYSWTANNTKYIYVPFIMKASMNQKISLVQEVIEHDDYKWLLEEEVEKYLTHKDNKRIFREALSIIGK